MKANEIKVGGYYKAKVSGVLVTVRVDEIRKVRAYKLGGLGEKTVYDVTNMKTGKKTLFRSAAKFREAAVYYEVPIGKVETELRTDPLGKLLTAALSEGEDGSDPRSGRGATTQSTSASATSGKAPTSVIAPRPVGRPSEPKSETGSVTALSAKSSGSGESSLAAKLGSLYAVPELTETVAGMTPTQEQRAVLEATRQQGLRTLVIGAGAGTGKTATLKMLEQVLPGSGQYTAFNSNLVAESKSKFRKAQCNTTHSLAFRAVGRNYSHRLGGQRVRSDQIAATLGIGAITVANGTKPDGTSATKVLQPGFLAGQVMVAIRSFCQSADRTVSTRHFRYIDGIDQPTEDGRRGRVNNEMVKQYLLPFAERAWEDLSRVDGHLPYSHDHYVKTWQLGEGKDKPVISADYILLDESQDTAPVMLDILKQQTHALLILVGDSNQCQPSGTKVKVVKAYRRGNRFTGCLPTIYKDTPIEAIRVGDIVASYDVSRSFFRRTGSRVLEIAKRPFDGEVVTVSVETKETSSFTPDHRCVVRIGDAFNNKWLVYLMKKGESFRVGMVKGMYETQLGDLGLPMRMRAEEAEAGWVLSVCDSEDQARLEEACISWSWGIPSLRFLQGMGRGISQASLNEFWSTIGDLSDKVTGLLTACGRDIRYPLCTSVTSIYRNRGCLVQACNLVDGILMLTMEGALASDGKRAAKNRWSKITVARQHYEGMVYSLRVADDETYVGDGIITHNSIYEWRGAVDAMKAFPGAPRRLLSQSFRFGQVIADIANSVLAELDEPTDLVMKGLPSIPSRVDILPEPRCVLCRTNATAVSTLLGAKASGKRPFLIGGSAEVVKFVKAAADLQRNVRTQHPELCCFESWKEVQEYVATDEGEDLKLMTKLVDEFQCAPILDALENMPTESEADMVVSTAHRSKGREWDTVKLAGDFPTANRMSDSDRRLLYVAVTRAKLVLDISQCPPFHDGKDKVTGETVTGLKIRYTVPMPTKEQGEVYLAEKKAPRLTPPTVAIYEQAKAAVGAGYGASPDVHGSDNPPPEGWKPVPTTPQSPTNGSFNKEGFTWTNWDGVWSVRGPKGQEGKTVTVTRKDGTTSPRKLLGVVKDFGDNCVYRV